VAEHSVHVSRLAHGAFEGLMHDASEAYLTDIASPVKPYLHNYKDLETNIMNVIGEKYGFLWPVSEDTKDADRAQLKTEARHLLRSGGRDWLDNYTTKRVRGIVPHCWSPEQAKMRFLERFYELTEITNVRNVA
jgi:5'-deoxynucleotidase YfbR-like HD superfamily hydrolase